MNLHQVLYLNLILLSQTFGLKGEREKLGLNDLSRGFFFLKISPHGIGNFKKIRKADVFRRSLTLYYRKDDLATMHSILSITTHGDL